MAAYRVAGLILAVGLYLLSPGCATAGLDEGHAAYERGDYHVAYREFMPLAHAGHPSAQFFVGVMFASGLGVRQDEAEAVRWFHLAADQGRASAQYALGVMYGEGRGVRHDEAKAVRWYRLAADRGIAEAQYALGAMYGDGRGVRQDEAEAVRWFRLAADQGVVEAQYALGGAYASGFGVRQDEAEAVRWYRLAANQGVAEAQNNLGARYAEGRGVPQDDLQAYMWLNLAAARLPQGEERTRTVALRDEVAARLSPAQRARGQELARNWQPSVAATSKGGSRDYGQAGPNPFRAELERRASRNREAQQLLANLGYDPGPVDGMVGPKTRAAIWAFQVDLGLPLDGQVSDELVAALREAAASGQRVAARPAPEPKSDGIAPWERYRAAAAPTQRRLDSTGSGFAISRSGHIVTNHHVVAGCAEVRVQPPDREAATAVVIAGDPANDLALLEATVGLPAAELRHDSGIRPGDSVVAVGFPLHGILASVANVTTGTVSALAGIGNDARFMQMTVPVQPGSSGGPLLDLQGRVVGVVVSKLDALRVASVTGDIPQNVNFAIKADVVRTFLHASNVPLTLSLEQARAMLSPAPQELSPAAVGAQAQKFTVLVECWK